jgi:hypothetical protein
MTAATCAVPECPNPPAPYSGRGRPSVYCLDHRSEESRRERNTESQRKGREGRRAAALFGLCHPDGHSRAVGRCKRCSAHCVPQRAEREVKRIRGLLRGTWQRPVTGGGGRPRYGTDPWDDEWLPARQSHGLHLVRDPEAKYAKGPQPTDPDTGRPLGALVPAPPDWDYEDRLADLDSTPGPNVGDPGSEMFEVLPFTYSSREGIRRRTMGSSGTSAPCV